MFTWAEENKFMTIAFSFLFVLLLWFFTFYQGITTAIDVWSISERFTHCFFVIPCAFYFIYQKRNILQQQPIIPNFWLLIPLMGLLILQTFGSIGNIQLFMHIASFASLPLLIWLMIGNKAASVIAFPLYFMLFSIPFGEALIPFLQDLTTDIAVPLLNMTGVPIYRNGLYLDIPEGQFLVAEACSGISFLIASVVFGHVYAYISFQRFYKQLTFVGISIIVPILANAIRVYGIVLTGHLSDMKYAAGADHIIYGGVFYGIIIFLLIVIGERFRDKKIHLTSFEGVITKGNVSFKSCLTVLVSVLFLFVAQFYWLLSIENNSVNLIRNDKQFKLSTLPLLAKEKTLTAWQPSFKHATYIQQGYLQNNEVQQSHSIEFFIATYADADGELISTQNRLYSAERWVLLEDTIIHISKEFSVVLTKLISPIGKIRYIAHWYELGGMNFTNKIKMKLLQTYNLLMKNQQIGRLVSFSIENSTETKKTKHDLLVFIERYDEAMNNKLNL